ncbi:uncharacterized protein LOC135829324 [Sycon ciliatum]|uniref:uncharacterized protein LOC135829324 n=1 Tax=Sycon ciliatum TaxID=27933 RepID=UPI0020AB40C7|eukprot:scpid82698/ scgid8688/ Cofilin; Actin-depolymerizing factor 1
MATSGIDVDAEITEVYNDVKLKAKHKFLIFKISDDKTSIIIDDEVPRAGSANTTTVEDCNVHFEAMKQRLGKEPRYILYDFGISNTEGRIVKKLAFIFWCPDNSPIGKKMIYASSKDSLKKVMTGIGIEFQANDASDMEFKDLVAEVLKKA